MESLSLLAAWAVICGIKAEQAQDRGRTGSMWFWRIGFFAYVAFWIVGLLDRLAKASA